MNSAESPAPSMLGKLLLARLSAGGKPPAKGELVKAVTPFFSSEFRQSDKAWKQLVLRTLEELSNADLTTHPTTSIRITAAGHQVVRGFLQCEELPEKRPTWSVFKRRYLFPLAVGTHPTGKVEQARAETADGMKAAILVKLLDLRVNAYPTFNQALRALLAHQGVVVSDVNQAQLCDGFLQKWLSDHQQETIRDSNTEPTESGHDLQQFAEQIRRIVRELRGESPVERVLISDVWKRFERDADAPQRRDFDEQLLLASEQQLLSLSRADLPGALPPEARRDSEIETPTGQIVHFVRS